MQDTQLVSKPFQPGSPNCGGNQPEGVFHQVAHFRDHKTQTLAGRFPKCLLQPLSMAVEYADIEVTLTIDRRISINRAQPDINVCPTESI